MMKLATILGLTGLCGVVLVTAGCGRGTTPAAAANVPSVGQLPPPGKTQGKGAMPDMVLYPAPQGVQTGVQGGKR